MRKGEGESWCSLARVGVFWSDHIMLRSRWVRARLALQSISFQNEKHVIIDFHPSFTSACCFCCFSCSPSQPPPCCWGGWCLRGIRMGTHHTPLTTGAGAQRKVTASPCGSSTWTWRTATSVRTMLWRSVGDWFHRLGVNTVPVYCNPVALCLCPQVFSDKTLISVLCGKRDLEELQYSVNPTLVSLPGGCLSLSFHSDFSNTKRHTGFRGFYTDQGKTNTRRRRRAEWWAESVSRNCPWILFYKCKDYFW